MNFFVLVIFQCFVYWVILSLNSLDYLICGVRINDRLLDSILYIFPFFYSCRKYLTRFRFFSYRYGTFATVPNLGMSAIRYSRYRALRGLDTRYATWYDVRKGV